MFFCNTQEIKYTNAPVKLLLPGIIANSKTIEPWDIIPFGGIHVCFTPISKITWGKESVTITDFFFGVNEYICTIGTSVISLKNVVSINHYPNNRLTKIEIHKNEFSKNNKTIKIINTSDTIYNGMKNIKTQEPFVFLKDTKIVLSAINIKTFYKTKEKVSININYVYNITQNNFEGSNFEALLQRIKENTFEVIDNFL